MKTIVYKLTDQDGYTRRGYSNETKWEIGEKVVAKDPGVGELCGPGWLHFYESPELAVLMNPMHANFSNPRLWKAQRGKKFLSDRGLKAGTTSLMILEELTLPECTTEIRVRFAILCSLAVDPNQLGPKYLQWAHGWLSGFDRSELTAMAAAESARSAAWAAARSARAAAARAAWAAAESARAARSAAESARAARSAADATLAAWAARAARSAADATLAAAREWAVSNKPLDLISVAKQAFDLSYIPHIDI